MPHLITSHQETNHVESWNDAHYNAGTIGPESYLLPIRQRMAASMIDANTLRILAGDAVCCGYRWEIEGDYEEINIENGTPGYNRIDLVVAHIETKPAERCDLRVIKGEETTETPLVPSHIDGDLNEGDTVTEMPICSVRINGINPQEPVKLMQELITLNGLTAEVRDSLSQKLGAKLEHGYYGMRQPDGGDAWIRTTSQGLIPEQSDNPKAALGTTGWRFASVWSVKFNGKTLLDWIHPVGDVVMRFNNTSPAALWGGTWVQIATGRVLRAANDVNTGGSDAVTLTVKQMPQHVHYYGLSNTGGGRSDWGLVGGGAFGGNVVIKAGQGSGTGAVSTQMGNGESHSIMQAYQDVFVWRRTA